MNLPPRDYTDQEILIARCLDEFGLRYEEQAYYHPYIVDFYIPELRMVVEADGTYGHLKKRDRKRDIKLQEYNDVEYILHIKENTRKAIKEFLCRELLNLTMIYYGRN